MSDSEPPVSFQTSPERYRHWRIEIDGDVARLVMDVDEQGGLRPGYELKLNSYDLGVDIELYDAVQRLRFEHPERTRRRDHQRRRQGVLRRGQHPDARGRPRTRGRSTSASSPTRRAAASRTPRSTPARPTWRR